MRKARLFWPLVLGLLLADCGTKRIAEDNLMLHMPQEVVGDVVRFTLAYNPGAAFGMHFGDASRIIFITLAMVALVVLWFMYRTTPADRRAQIVALGLVAGGALGNLADRFRGSGGVVDFIDVGLGGTRFWTFNVADAGITVGAVILALTLWTEPDPESEPSGPSGLPPGSSASPPAEA